jgi:hypothetical protein
VASALALALAVAALAPWACVVARAWAGGSVGAGWLAGAVMSRTFIAAAAAAVLSAAALSLTVCVLWQVGAEQRARRAAKPGRSGERGSAVLEFTLALPTALVLSLVMAQSSLLMAGNLCVQYSAVAAARTAIVQIPLDLSDGEPANVIDGRALAGKGERVRRAAIWCVMPFSSGAGSGPGDPLGDDLARDMRDFFDEQGASWPWWLGPSHGGRYLGRKLAYADDYTDVTVLQRIGSAFDPPEYAEPRWPCEYQSHEEVRVRVEHVFYLAVPYVARVFAAVGEGRDTDAGRGLLLTAAASATNEGQADYIPVEVFD